MTLLVDGSAGAVHDPGPPGLGAGFDDAAARSICEVAAAICAVPSAGVHLRIGGLPPRSVWHGTVPPGMTFEETPCARVIEGGEPVVVGDLPGTFDPGGFRAYAGVPIIGRSGTAFGSLCVLDMVCRDFSSRQMRCLLTLAAQVAGGLELLNRAREADEIARQRDHANTVERRSLARVQTIVEGLADGILLLDDARERLVVNEAFCRLMRIPETPRDLHADPAALSRRIAAARYDEPIRMFGAFLNVGGVVQESERHDLHLPDGTLLELTRAHLAVDQVAGGSLWQLRDVTERRRQDDELARSQERLHALFESSPLAIFVLDANGNPILVSDGCAYMFGSAEARHDPVAWTKVLLTEDRDRAIAAWATAMEERTALDTTYRIWDPEGKVAELIVQAAPMRSSGGQFRGWIGTVADVTEKARSQRALALSRAELEVRNEEMHSLAHSKEEMLAAISHEFRTPLTSISTFLQMLQSGEQELGEEQRRALEVIARNTERLGGLVTDLLSVKDTPEEPDVSPKEVFLQGLAAEAVAAASERARAAGIELRVERGEPTGAWADPRRIAQIMDSLLDNALKFTPRGGEIVVVPRSAGGLAEISVSDTGPGIDREELERVFERFYQGSAGRSSGRGSGLGLAIVRRLLHAQGGEIEVRSKHGEGATFVISLPGLEPG